MPARSERQRKMMGAALGRKRAGKSKKSDPKMDEEQLRHFAKKSTGKTRKTKSGVRRVRSS